MKDNLEKVLERDAKLSTLENRAGKNPLDYECHEYINTINQSFRCSSNWCIAIYNQRKTIKT